MEKEVIIKQLKDALNIQLSDGNWNYNSYMHGMANGIIFALAVVEGTDPKYLDRPEEWLENKKAQPEEELKELPIGKCETCGANDVIVGRPLGSSICEKCWNEFEEWKKNEGIE